MYQRVLVPLDGSTTALQVLPYAKLVVMGSVTDRVARHSPGPVLVIRPTGA